MKSSPMHTDSIARKCCKAADLSVSAWGLGSEDEAYAAAYTAGQLAYKAGRTWDELAEAAPALVTSGNCWLYAVDGWDAARQEASR